MQDVCKTEDWRGVLCCFIVVTSLENAYAVLCSMWHVVRWGHVLSLHHSVGREKVKSALLLVSPHDPQPIKPMTSLNVSFLSRSLLPDIYNQRKYTGEHCYKWSAL